MPPAAKRRKTGAVGTQQSTTASDEKDKFERWKEDQLRKGSNVLVKRGLLDPDLIIPDIMHGTIRLCEALLKPMYNNTDNERLTLIECNVQKALGEKRRKFYVYKKEGSKSTKVCFPTDTGWHTIAEHIIYSADFGHAIG